MWTVAFFPLFPYGATSPPPHAFNPLIKPSVGVHFHPLPDAIVLTAGYLPLTLIVDLPSIRFANLTNPCTPAVKAHLDRSLHSYHTNYTSYRGFRIEHFNPTKLYRYDRIIEYASSGSVIDKNYQIIDSDEVLERERKWKITKSDLDDRCLRTDLIMLEKDAIIYKNKLQIVRDKLKHVKSALHSFTPRFSFNKRGLLNFVGDGLSWLFGTVSQADITKLQRKLSQILQNDRRQDSGMKSINPSVPYRAPSIIVLSHWSRMLTNLPILLLLSSML